METKIRNFNLKTWNKKIYGNSVIYLNNEKIEINNSEFICLMLSEGYYIDIAKKAGFSEEFMNNLPWAGCSHEQERFDIIRKKMLTETT